MNIPVGAIRGSPAEIPGEREKLVAHAIYFWKTSSIPRTNVL